MELELTNDEIKAIKYYKEEAFDNINQLLITDSRLDIAMLSGRQDDDDKKISYQKKDTVKYLDTIKKIYGAILNSYFNQERKKNWEFYYVANLSDIQKLKNEPYMDTFILSTSKEGLEKEKNVVLGNNQVIVKASGSKEIPYINLKDILNSKKDEVLISLFTEVKDVIEADETKVGNKNIRTYNIKLEAQELQEMSDSDKSALYDYIVSNSDSVNEALINAADWEKENVSNYEKIRELEKQVSDNENDINNKEIEGNYGESQKELDSIALDKLKAKLDGLKKESAEIFEKIKNSNKIITDWKKNITVYLMAECNSMKEDVLEKIKAQNEKENEKIKNYEIKERVKTEELSKEKFENILQEVQTGCMDNEVLVKRLIGDINKLITRQQYFAKIAQSMNATYSALNNSFEMKKNAEELEDLLSALKNKVDELSKLKGTDENIQKLLKISETNNQITVLINYLNNPKSIAVKPKINRFEEMIVVEENELKRNIAKTVLEVRGEAELKKLKDDTEIIESKSPFLKFLGIFTGQNKLDDFMLDQIEVREKHIKKTLSKELRLDFNYSIHELVAEIRMFINDNSDDELVADDILILKDLENEIKKNFIIIESKVEDIINEKENKNLPIESKVSKQEMIEIETYRFLNKYGYDTEEDKPETTEASYVDTTAKEIARIIEYINTAEIL